MGGQINIAARFNDNQTICIDGWTNFIPNMIMNDATLSGDDTIVRKTLIEVASHKSYEGPQAFRASGYGIVVIDFVTKTIHSMQGYTSFTDKSLAQMFDLNKSMPGPNGFVLSNEGKSLLENNRVQLVGKNGEELEPEILTSEKALTLKKQEAASFMRGDGMLWYQLNIKTDPFTIIDYPEGKSLAEIKKHLKNAGFPLTKAGGLNALFA